jgi:hypothetical protein
MPLGIYAGNMACDFEKGIAMKRIARTLVIVALATAASAAIAADPSYPQRADNPYPAEVEPVVPLSQEFSNIDTYKREHRNSAVEQAPMTYPSAGLQEYPLSGEFPNMQTYEDLHRNAPVARSNTPTFPYSVDPVRSMAEEGLVPGIPGEAPYAYARNQTADESTQTAQGATR